MLAERPTDTPPGVSRVDHEPRISDVCPWPTEVGVSLRGAENRPVGVDRNDGSARGLLQPHSPRLFLADVPIPGEGLPCGDYAAQK